LVETITPETEAPVAAPEGGEAPASPPRPSRPPRREGGRDFRARRKVCIFCVEKIREIDYKEAGRLRRFISDRGKIEPRRKTGTCAKHQRRLSVALKRARFMALLPFTGQHIRNVETGRGEGGRGYDGGRDAARGAEAGRAPDTTRSPETAPAAAPPPSDTAAAAAPATAPPPAPESAPVETTA
jgi:small subunit ribosomal protein S18